MEFLTTYNAPLASKKFLKGFLEHEYYDALNHAPVDLDFPSLLELPNDKDISKEISVIIVDHNMPGMTGIELCRELKDTSVKKILLTGEISQDEAVRAFNNNIIDCYIRKDTPNLLEEIKFFIATLTQKYLSKRTQEILNHLEADGPLPMSDIAFINFFAAWCKEKNIIEYYLIDKNGSFFVVDKNKEASYFITHSESSLKNFIELYSEEEFGTVIQKTKQKELIPFFGTGIDPLQININEWPAYFYKPNIIEGREKYYWTVIGANQQ